MNARELMKAYPIFTSASHHFHYPAGRADEEIALDVVEHLVVSREHLPQALTQLVAECNAMIAAMPEQWEAIARDVNRPFRDRAQAREWMLRVVSVWEKALRELEGDRRS